MTEQVHLMVLVWLGMQQLWDRASHPSCCSFLGPVGLHSGLPRQVSDTACSRLHVSK